MWTLKLMGDLYLEHMKNLCKPTKQIQETLQKMGKEYKQTVLKKGTQTVLKHARRSLNRPATQETQVKTRQSNPQGGTSSIPWPGHTEGNHTLQVSSAS